jgi:hypothetical protein
MLECKEGEAVWPHVDPGSSKATSDRLQEDCGCSVQLRSLQVRLRRGKRNTTKPMRRLQRWHSTCRDVVGSGT